MVSNKCPSTGENVIASFRGQKVTIAMVQAHKNTLNFSFMGLQCKKWVHWPTFILLNFDYHVEL